MKKTVSYSTLLKEHIDHHREKKISYPISIICSPSDYGVIKNKGRCGSRWAPKAITNQISKFNSHLNLDKDERILITEATNQSAEQIDYLASRTHETKQISHELENSSSIIHLGGGHDHVFSLLMAIDQSPKYENIIILNIDAHCDTRTDEMPNSGTPFRDFDRNATKPFHLIQYGLQSYANSSSTLSPLENGSEEKFFIHEIKKPKQNSHVSTPLNLSLCPFSITDKTAFVFSLDCDGIDASEMKAVSAVNPDGLSFNDLSKLQTEFEKISKKNTLYGIYEFNPVFEDSSLSSLKKISAFLYQVLESRLD